MLELRGRARAKQHKWMGQLKSTCDKLNMMVSPLPRESEMHSESAMAR